MGKNRPRSKGVDVTKSLLATTGVADYLTVQIVPGQTVQVTCDEMSPTQGSEAAAALRREGKLDVSLRLCTNWKQGSCYNRAACTFAHVHRFFNVDGTNRTDSMSYAAAVTANSNREGGLIITNNNNNNSPGGVFTFTTEQSLTPTGAINNSSNVGEGNNVNSNNSSLLRNKSNNTSSLVGVGEGLQQQQQQHRRRRQSNDVSNATLNGNELDSSSYDNIVNNSKNKGKNINNNSNSGLLVENNSSGGSTYASKCAPYSNVVKNGRTAATGVTFTTFSQSINNNTSFTSNSKKSSFFANGGSIVNNNSSKQNNNSSSHSGSNNSISGGTLSWLEKLAPNASHPTHNNNNSSSGQPFYPSSLVENVEESASDINFTEHIQQCVHNDNDKSIDVDEDDDDNFNNEDESNDNCDNDERIGMQENKRGYNKSGNLVNTVLLQTRKANDEEEEEEEKEEEEEELVLESPTQYEEPYTSHGEVGVGSTVEYDCDDNIDTNDSNTTVLEHVDTSELGHKGKMINLHDLQRAREVKTKLNEKATSVSQYNTTSDVIHNISSSNKKMIYKGNEANPESSPQDLNSQSLCESESNAHVEHSRNFSRLSISSHPSLRDADHHTLTTSVHGDKNLHSSKGQYNNNNKTSSNNNIRELEHQQVNSSEFTFSSISPYREQQHQEQQQFSVANTTQQQQQQQQMYQSQYNSGVNESGMMSIPPPIPLQHPSSLPSMFPVHHTNTQISSYPNLFTYDSSRNNTALNGATLLNYNNINTSVNNAGNFNNYANTVGYGHSSSQIGNYKNNIHHLPHSFAPSALSAVTAMYDTNKYVASHNDHVNSSKEQTLIDNAIGEATNNCSVRNVMFDNTTNQKAIKRVHYHISEFTSWPIWLCGTLHPLLLKEKNEQTQREQSIAEDQLVGNSSIPSLEQRTGDEENETVHKRRHLSHILLSVEDMTLKDRLVRELIGCDEEHFSHTNKVMAEDKNNGTIWEGTKEQYNSVEEMEGEACTQAANLTGKTNCHDNALFTSNSSSSSRRAINRNISEFSNHACEVNGVSIDSESVMHYPIQLSSTEPTKSLQLSEPLFSPATNTNYSPRDESDGDVQQRESNGQYTNELQELIWLLTNSKSEQELEKDGTDYNNYEKKERRR